MAGRDARLATASLRLTPLERARLVWRARVESQTLDYEARQVLRPDEPECKRIVDAIEDANREIHNSLGLVCEWLYQEQTQLGWLRCLDSTLEREQLLRSALEKARWSVVEDEGARVSVKEKMVVLPPILTPGWGLERFTPLVWGVKAFPDDEEAEPSDVASLRGRLVFEGRRALELRWHDYLTQSAVLEELADVVGEDVTHPELAKLREAFGEALLRMHEEFRRLGEDFERPEPDRERIARYRGWVRWDDLKPSSERASYVPPHIQQKVDELEARLVAELRGGSANA